MVRALCLLLVLGLTVPAQAQETRTIVPQSPILTIEPDRLFTDSAFGQRLTKELESEGATIAGENRQIEAELIAEEQRLTEQRPDLAPDDFRLLADAFDEKVQRLRREQDAKARALGAKSDEKRREFLAAVQPILAEIMRQSAAAMIIERRTVFLSADVVDITNTAIARIDAKFGDGSETMPPDAAGDLPKTDPVARDDTEQKE